MAAPALDDLPPTDDEVRRLLAVTPEERERYANLTQDIVDPATGRRVKNPAWLAARGAGGVKRITGSAIGDLLGYGYSSKTEGAGVAAFLDDGFAGNRATEWGSANEHVAQAEFVEWARQHLADPDARVREYGLIVDLVRPWLAYSPDGEVHAQGRRFLLEIKCPYSRRLVRDGSEPLYGVHPWPNGQSGPVPVYYWFQMQLGFYIMGLSEGFFVIWTPHVLQVHRVAYDPAYFQDTVLSAVDRVFFKKYLPQLRLKRLLEAPADDAPTGDAPTDPAPADPARHPPRTLELNLPLPPGAVGGAIGLAVDDGVVRATVGTTRVPFLAAEHDSLRAMLHQPHRVEVLRTVSHRGGAYARLRVSASVLG
ncbi:MAG: lambda exonuclease family protein [Pseudomonadota bacterium]